jgi:hypothetical protein
MFFLCLREASRHGLMFSENLLVFLDLTRWELLFLAGFFTRLGLLSLAGFFFPPQVTYILTFGAYP